MGSGDGRVLDLDVAEGELDRRGEGTIALSTYAARYFRTDLGETFEFRTGDGSEVSAEVEALDRRDLAYGLSITNIS